MVVLTATFLFYLFLSVWMNLYGKGVPLMSLVIKINQLLRNTTLPWALRFTGPRIKVIAVSFSLQYSIWKWQWRALLSVASRVFVCHYLGPPLPHNLEVKPVAQWSEVEMVYQCGFCAQIHMGHTIIQWKYVKKSCVCVNVRPKYLKKFREIFKHHVYYIQALIHQA